MACIKAVELDPGNEKTIHKYMKALNIKFNILIPFEERREEKKQFSERLLNSWNLSTPMTPVQYVLTMMFHSFSFRT